RLPPVSMATSWGVNTATTTGCQPDPAPTLISAENGIKNFSDAASHTTYRTLARSRLSASVTSHASATMGVDSQRWLMMAAITPSVLGWPFNVVDHEHVDGPSRGFQLEPELLLQRREQRRAVRIDRRQRRCAGRRITATLRELLRCPGQIDL